MLSWSGSTRGTTVGLILGGSVLVLLAGCASTTSSTGASSSPTSSSPTSSSPTSSSPSSSAPGSSKVGPSALTVVVHGGSAGTHTWTLTCDPIGGDHPDPAAACAALIAMGDKAFSALPTGMMCTQIYGGPQTATVRGTWRGTAVDTTFSRTDGCQIGRWTAYQALLVVKGGA